MEDEDKLVEVSMTIILNSGNARFKANEALDYLAEGLYTEARNALEKARVDITLAHQAQTIIIQAESRGEKQETTLLFAHAQDTLMTVMSEINLIEKLLIVFKRLEERMLEEA